MDLKTEFAARAERRRRTGRRLFAGAAVAGLAAAAAIAVPLLTGSETPAYAVAKNPDGSLIVTINELQDPKGLQARLNNQGIRADVTYTPRDKMCAPGRGVGADYAYDPPERSALTAQQRAEFDRPENWRSADAASPISWDKLKISPSFMRPEETLVLEFRLGNDPRVKWNLRGWLAKAGSTVRPCTLVDEAGADKEVSDKMIGS